LDDLYQAALIVVADTPPSHSFFEGMKLVKSDLRQRFGQRTIRTRQNVNTE